MSSKIKGERLQRAGRGQWDDMRDFGWSSENQVIKLLDIPSRALRKRLAMTVTLDETKRRGENTMRCVFTTELKVDIDTTDDPLRKAFIDFVLAKAREVYGSAAMLAKTPPVMTVSVTSREGKQVLPVFGAPTRDVDEDDMDI